jgi:hypothetical protein
MLLLLLLLLLLQQCCAYVYQQCISAVHTHVQTQPALHTLQYNPKMCASACAVCFGLAVDAAAAFCVGVCVRAGVLQIQQSPVGEPGYQVSDACYAGSYFEVSANYIKALCTAAARVTVTSGGVIKMVPLVQASYNYTYPYSVGATMNCKDLNASGLINSKPVQQAMPQPTMINVLHARPPASAIYILLPLYTLCFQPALMAHRHQAHSLLVQQLLALPKSSRHRTRAAPSHSRHDRCTL